MPPPWEALKARLAGAESSLVQRGVFLPVAGGWVELISKVLSNPAHSMIPSPTVPSSEQEPGRLHSISREAISLSYQTCPS